jgi:hypothetical protein
MVDPGITSNVHLEMGNRKWECVNLFGGVGAPEITVPMACPCSNNSQLRFNCISNS